MVQLTTEKILTPCEYAIRKGIKKPGGISGKINEDPYGWAQSTICKILSTQEYCGDIVDFKTYSISYKNKKRHANNPEDMLVFKDVNEAIVDREIFEVIQLKRGKIRKRITSSGEKICFQACLCVRIVVRNCIFILIIEILNILTVLTIIKGS